MRWHKPATAKERRALRQKPFAWKIYKGDMVGVNRGPFKGMTGEVIRTHKKWHVLRVKGVNVVKCKVWDHKTDPDQPRRVWVEEERPIHYSDVNLLDPVSQERTKVDFRYLETGERVRIARNSGAIVSRAPTGSGQSSISRYCRNALGNFSVRKLSSMLNKPFDA